MLPVAYLLHSHLRPSRTRVACRCHPRRYYFINFAYGYFPPLIVVGCVCVCVCSSDVTIVVQYDYYNDKFTTTSLQRQVYNDKFTTTSLLRQLRLLLRRAPTTTTTTSSPKNCNDPCYSKKDLRKTFQDRCWPRSPFTRPLHRRIGELQRVRRFDVGVTLVTLVYRDKLLLDLRR